MMFGPLSANFLVVLLVRELGQIFLVSKQEYQKRARRAANSTTSDSRFSFTQNVVVLTQWSENTHNSTREK
jgi:hypothetical protein